MITLRDIRIGMAILLLVTGVMPWFAGPAHAQTGTVMLDIPPQDLSAALSTFAQQANVQVLYASELARGHSTQGVVGAVTPQEGVQRLLEGTGLQYTFTDEKTVTLQQRALPGMAQEEPAAAADTTAFRPIKVPEITVRERTERGYKTDEEVSSPTRLPAPVRDMPQSVEVITRKLMDDQKAVRIQDVIRNVSGTFISSTGGGRQEFINIRGFNADLNIFKNGFRDDSFFANRVFRETSNLQRIEILKGPASFLYGRADPGGIMNLITKRPLADPYYSGELIVGSYNLYRPMVDISGPLNESKSVLYRFNGLYESAGSFRDGVSSDRIFLAPTVTWELGLRTSLRFEGEYLYDDRVIDRGLVAIGRGVAPVSRSTFLGDPTRRTAFNQGKATLTLLHELNSNWTWRTGFRASIGREDYDSIEQTGTPTAAGAVGLQRLQQPTLGQSYYLQNEVIGVFSLGPFEQRLLAGVELAHERLSQTITSTTLGGTNIFAPTRLFTPTAAPVTFFDGHNQSNFVAPYLVDQIALLENLKLTLGGRFDIFRQEQASGGVTDTLSQNFFSPMAGLTYQVAKPVTLYTNYSRSFTPQFGLRTADGEMVRPASGTQYEAGMKLEPLGGRLFANVGVFHIKQGGLATTDVSDPNGIFVVATGERRSQGVELDVAGRVMSGWDLIATYAYIDAEITRDEDFTVGNTLANVPLHSGSLWSVYTIQSGILQNVGFGLGAYAAGKRLGDLANSYEMPGYVRLDAALYYRKPEVTKRTNLIASLNFRNLLDTEYYEGSRENRREIYAGVPLTVIGSLKLEFH